MNDNDPFGYADDYQTDPYSNDYDYDYEREQDELLERQELQDFEGIEFYQEYPGTYCEDY